MAMRLFHDTTYQYEFARRAAESLDDTVIAALLRPGYSDGRALRSSGKVGWKNGGNYTRNRIDLSLATP
jgi:hypothetical protein